MFPKFTEVPLSKTAGISACDAPSLSNSATSCKGLNSARAAIARRAEKPPPMTRQLINEHQPRSNLRARSITCGRGMERNFPSNCCVFSITDDGSEATMSAIRWDKRDSSRVLILSNCRTIMIRRLSNADAFKEGFPVLSIMVGRQISKPNGPLSAISETKPVCQSSTLNRSC